MTYHIVQIVCAANGSSTPHDNLYVKRWNPHTPAGILDITSTGDIRQARRFQKEDLWKEWKMVSNVMPKRPWDGRPNRPLTGLTINVILVKE